MNGRDRRVRVTYACCESCLVFYFLTACFPLVGEKEILRLQSQPPPSSCLRLLAGLFQVAPKIQMTCNPAFEFQAKGGVQLWISTISPARDGMPDTDSSSHAGPLAWAPWLLGILTPTLQNRGQWRGVRLEEGPIKLR